MLFLSLKSDVMGKGRIKKVFDPHRDELWKTLVFNMYIFWSL